MKRSDGEEDYPDNWHVECQACGSLDFIHEHQLRRQKSEAIEVFDGLPSEMQELLQPERVLPKRPPGIFSLSAEEPEDF